MTTVGPGRRGELHDDLLCWLGIDCTASVGHNVVGLFLRILSACLRFCVPRALLLDGVCILSNRTSGCVLQVFCPLTRFQALDYKSKFSQKSGLVGFQRGRLVEPGVSIVSTSRAT